MKRTAISVLGAIALVFLLRCHEKHEAVVDTNVSSIATSTSSVPEPFEAPSSTEEYRPIHENAFLRAAEKPLSTFSIDVDTASYANVRRFLRSGQLPPRDAVRIEELVNYFRYDYPQPENGRPFDARTTLARCPWNESHRLLHVALQARSIPASELPPSNLVFLIDVSGSMESEDKLPLVKSSLRLLVDELLPGDSVAIVTYAGSAGLVLPATSGAEKEKILRAIERLESGGSTAGGEGIQLAYKVARERFLSDGNNRVILATDGDFNVGVSSESELEQLIERERDGGIFLTVLGFGTGNYKDSKMEVLADAGNGNYAYVDSLREAQRVLVRERSGTLFAVAKDVKIQIEFNPAQVAVYRLLGYENRILSKEDFSNDRKDAGDLGAGQSVTALYELVLADGVSSDDLLTLKVRYKAPKSETSEELVATVRANDGAGAPAGEVRFAAAVAELGMLLRNSEHKGEASFDSVLSLAEESLSHDQNEDRKEFLELVRRAAELQHQAGREATPAL